VVEGQPGFPLGVGEGAKFRVTQPDDAGKVRVTLQEVIHRFFAGHPAVLAGLPADEMNHRITLGDVVVQLDEDGLA